MRRLFFAVLASLACLSIVNPAQASPIDDAIDGLKSNPVYIAPGTENISLSAADDLAGQLNDSDTIAIVVLPVSIGDPQSAALMISKAMDGKRIIAVVTGDQFATASVVPPASETADLMHRAQRVATNQVEALSTFIRNVHTWQALHPPAIQRTDKPLRGDGFPWLPVLMVVVLMTGGGILLYRMHRATAPGNMQFSASPEAVRRQLREIARLQGEITDKAMQNLVGRVCRDTNEYYKRAGGTGNDVKVFPDLLGQIRDVVTQYVTIQNDVANGCGYYYKPRDPKQLLEIGHRSVEDFAERLAQSIAEGMSAALGNYQVQTEILKANRNTDYENA